MDRKRQGSQPPPGGPLPGSGGTVYIQRRPERKHDYPRGQSGGAQGPAAPVREEGQVHLY